MQQGPFRVILLVYNHTLIEGDLSGLQVGMIFYNATGNWFTIVILMGCDQLQSLMVYEQTLMEGDLSGLQVGMIVYHATGYWFTKFCYSKWDLTNFKLCE